MHEPQSTATNNLIHLSQSKFLLICYLYVCLPILKILCSLSWNIFISCFTLIVYAIMIVLKMGNIAKYDYGNEDDNVERYGQPTLQTYNITSMPKNDYSFH